MSEIITTAADNNLIVIKQLPIIENKLLAVKENIQSRLSTARSLVCTEDNYKEIKKVRSDFNKEFAALEQQRKSIKEQILDPYKNFETVYKDCVGDPYTEADQQLKQKIAEVEDGLRAEKEADLEAYFAEYRASLDISEDIVQLKDAGIKVGLSDSRKSLHEKAAAFLDKIDADIKVIGTLEDGDEVFAEYRKTLNLSSAMLLVSERKKAIEEAKARREEREAAAAAAKAAEEKVKITIKEDDQMVSIPIKQPEKVEEEQPKLYTAKFTVRATMDKLKALKAFLEEGGYEYGQQ